MLSLSLCILTVLLLLLRWILLGMLYICTEGLEISGLVILPRIVDLCTLLPGDNKISLYFKTLGVGTKCVTDVTNLIHTSLKKNPQIFEKLRSIS